jgi:MinD superfamily P-loop ATPase
LFAAAVSQGSTPVMLAGFDITKPDLLEFLNEAKLEAELVNAAHPNVDSFKCKYCGICYSYCPEKAIQFNRYIPSVTLIVARCSACGNCMKVCSRKAISTKIKNAGRIYHASLPGRNFIVGALSDNSEYKVPVIQALLDKSDIEGIVICDFGPGDDAAIRIGLTGMDFILSIISPEDSLEQTLENLATLTKSKVGSTGVILNHNQKNINFLQQTQSLCDQFEIPLIGIIPYNDKYKGENLIFHENINFDDTLMFREIFNKTILLMDKNTQTVIKN